MQSLCALAGRHQSFNVCLRAPILLGHFRSLTTRSIGNRFKPCSSSCSRIVHSITAADKTTAFDPYAYTQGRWLDRDTERRKARDIRFNFDALLDIAVKSSDGAREIVSCEKKEGSFNRAFVISLDNGATVVARVPNRLAGPPRLTVSSEVATLQYGNG